jgi:SAM-dependent methyltransferase
MSPESVTFVRNNKVAVVRPADPPTPGPVSSPLKRDLQSAGETCPSCGSPNLLPFYSVGATPVTCASVFDSAAQARAVPSGRVDLVLCRHCALIFNMRFDADLAEIGARYESSQAASAHFGQFARSLSHSWVDRHALRGKHVLEVGCGDGAFLRLMLDAGASGATGLDPLAPSSACGTGAAPGLSIEARLFDTSTLDMQADALVCRHTLEHVPRVGAFLADVAAWARRGPGRVVLFEVPATERVLAEHAFWDIYYEHCSYFTETSLAHAFRLAGFDVLNLERVYGEQYLVIDAAPGKLHPLDVNNHAALDAACLRFGAETRRAVEHCDAGLEALCRGGDTVVLWQGAAKTVGFLSALAHADLVQAAVDLNPGRHGKFLPGSGLPICAPEELQQLRPDHVVLMNPAYLTEVQAYLDRLAVPARLMTVNQLCAGDLPGEPGR